MTPPESLGRVVDVGPVGLVLRSVVAVAGAVALLAGWSAGVPAVLVVLGLLCLALAVRRPGGSGPALVLGAAAGAWAVKHGTGEAAPLAGTLLVALAAAAHHQAAALAAALPPGARVDRAVLVRFARHAGLVLGLTAAVAVFALAVARPGGSIPLEVLGLTAAVLAAAVPVLLGRADIPADPG